MIETGCIEPAAICDPADEMLQAAQALAPQARLVSSYEAMLALDLDGIVIATPSALHAAQSIAALRQGIAVFCQKPLGRTAAEVQAVVEAARQADRLLQIDLSYRFAAGPCHLRALAQQGTLGHVFAADLVFHNAYGPDKPWFYDRALSGGGCVADLGVHLIDLALWMLDFPAVERVDSHLLAAGRPLAGPHQVEDYAVATLTLAGGTVVRIACSWKLHAGTDAVISAQLYGTQGGAGWHNVGGSFHDFAAHAWTGTTTQTLCIPPDAWGPRAAADWARRLAAGATFDPDVARCITVAQAMDRVYAGA